MVKMTTYAFPSDCIKLALSTMFPICTKPPSAVMQAAVADMFTFSEAFVSEVSDPLH